ncbi:MAG: serine/threonine protein kinase [Myxococcales bacterium]|nr:serine/threonine protein kinase [Myxococcales bacterium]
MAEAAVRDPTQRGREFAFHECLGRGGFAEVYRTTMVRGSRHEVVAVKVLHVDDHRDSQPIQRLRDEARMLACIRHPHILRVHDLVVLDGRLALVSEFVDGSDLQDLVRQHALGRRAAVEVVACVAEALDHALHAPAGDCGTPLALVHRDVKPANIRVGRDGSVKLLDFGIARAAIEKEAHTNPDSAFGSFPYMAPEQFADGAGPPTAAVDVYALGVTLYEALVGERLWQGTLKDVYLLSVRPEQHATELEARLARVGGDPATLELLHQMLAFAADARPTAAEVARRLRELAPSLPGASLADSVSAVRWPPVRAVRGELAGRVFHEDFVDPESVGSPQGPRPARADQAPTVLIERPVGEPVVRPPAPVPRPITPPPRRGTVAYIRAHSVRVTAFLVFGALSLPALMLAGMVGTGVLMRLVGG